MQMSQKTELNQKVIRLQVGYRSELLPTVSLRPVTNNQRTSYGHQIYRVLPLTCIGETTSWCRQ